MLTTVFSFFQIDRCGYYEDRIPGPKFGDISIITEELKTWITGKSLEQTCTYQVVNGGNYLRTFCLAIEPMPKSESLLITLWNEVPHSKGRITSVQADQNVGTVNIQRSKLPPKSIPGYPTYFWIFPKENIYATVGEKGNKTSNPSFVRYLHEFISKFTKYVAYDPNDNSKILGYRKTNKDTPLELKPKFIVGLKKKESTIAYIKNNHDQIRKIIQKNKLSPNKGTDKTRLQEIWNSLSFGQYVPPSTQTFHRIRYEVDCTPTLEQLNTMIEEWDSNDEKDGWNNIGFKLQKEVKTRWIDQSIARFSEDTNIKREDSGFFKQSDLIATLKKLKPVLLPKVLK